MPPTVLVQRWIVSRGAFLRHTFPNDTLGYSSVANLDQSLCLTTLAGPVRWLLVVPSPSRPFFFRRIMMEEKLISCSVRRRSAGWLPVQNERLFQLSFSLVIACSGSTSVCLCFGSIAVKAMTTRWPAVGGNKRNKALFRTAMTHAHTHTQTN